MRERKNEKKRGRQRQSEGRGGVWGNYREFFRAKMLGLTGDTMIR